MSTRTYALGVNLQQITDMSTCNAALRYHYTINPSLAHSLCTVGAPPAQVDPAAVSTGDRVRVELEPELFQAMQEGRGVWNDLMLNVSTEKVEKVEKYLHHSFVLPYYVVPFVPCLCFHGTLFIAADTYVHSLYVAMVTSGYVYTQSLGFIYLLINGV